MSMNLILKDKFYLPVLEEYLASKNIRNSLNENRNKSYIWQLFDNG